MNQKQSSKHDKSVYADIKSQMHTHTHTGQWSIIGITQREMFISHTSLNEWPTSEQSTWIIQIKTK